jgi:hypothetical protein
MPVADSPDFQLTIAVTAVPNSDNPDWQITATGPGGTPISGGGGLLAFSQYAPGTKNVYTQTGDGSGLIPVDSTNPDLSIQWITPSSGNVLVQLNGTAESGAATHSYWGLTAHDTGHQVGYTVTMLGPGQEASPVASILLLGGTPGVVNYVDWAWQCTSGAMQLSCQGVQGAPNGINTGPATMLVWAAP